MRRAPATAATAEGKAIVNQVEEENAAEQTAQIEPAIATTEESTAGKQDEEETAVGANCAGLRKRWQHRRRRQLRKPVQF